MNQIHQRENSSSLSFRGRVIYQISLWMGFLGILLAIARLGTASMPVLPTLLIFVFTSSLFLPAIIVRQTGQSKIAGLILILVVFLIGVNGAFFNSGVMAPVVVLFVVLPIVVVISTGTRFFQLLFILPAVGLGISYAVKKLGWASPLINPDRYDEYKTVVYIGASFIVGLISYLYEKNRNRLEKSYEFERTNFQNLFESTPACVFIIDSELRIHAMNSYGVFLLGAKDYESLHQKKINIFCQDDFQSQFESYVQKILETKVEQVADFQFCLANQKKIWLKIYGQIFIEKEGGIQFLGVAHDVTQEKTEALIAELNIKTLHNLVSRRALKEILADIGGFLSKLNPHFLVKILLEKNGELVTAVSLNFPDDYLSQTSVLKIGPDLGSSGAAAYLGMAVSCPDVLTDPRWVHFQESVRQLGLRSSFAQPIVFDGRVLGAFGIYSRHSMELSDWEWALLGAAADLAAVVIESNRLETEAELHRQSMDRIQRMASLGEVSAGIAHEINNPLAIIKLKSELLLKKLKPLEDVGVRESVEKDVQVIQQTVDRIGKIVKGMKALSRNAEGENPQDVLVNEVIVSAFSFMEETLKLAGVDVDMKIQETRGQKIHCNSVQMEQVFVNLIQNSMDALFGQTTKWIKIQTQVQGNQLILSFKDSGPGIPAEIREKIMQPFFTTKPPGKGTGIGLSFSWNVISQQGGQFRLDEETANTCFVIEWPISP